MDMNKRQIEALALALRKVDTVSVPRSGRQVDHYRMRIVDSGLVSAASLGDLASARADIEAATTVAGLRSATLAFADALAGIVLGRTRWEAAKEDGA